MNDSAGDYDHVGIAHKTDGTLDNSFNGTGIYAQLIGDYCNANAVAIQSDGKIVAAGVCYNSGAGNDFFLLRLNTDGSIDNSFGTNGVVITDFNFHDDRVDTIAIQ